MADFIVGGGGGIRKISLAVLLEKELRCRTLPTNGKLYPEDQSEHYSVSGQLLYVESSSYQTLECLDREPFGKPIGSFTVSGVIQEDQNVLAFRYNARDALPAGRSDVKDIMKNVPAFIHTQRECAFANYLHLRSMLQQEKPTIVLKGKIQNSSPRLFLAKSMAVKAGELQAVHGFLMDYNQNRPVYR